MKNNKVIISVMLIGFIFLLTGTVSYFRNVLMEQLQLNQVKLL